MTIRIKRIALCWFCLFMFAMSPIAAANVENRTVSFNGFASYTMPSGLSVVSIPNVTDWLQTMEKTIPAPLRDELLRQLQLAGTEKDLPFTLGIYQLTHFDRKDYRQAYLVSIHLKSPYTELTPYVIGKPDEAKLKFAQSINAQIKENLTGLSYLDPTTKTGGKILELSPVRLFSIEGDRTAYALGVRYLLQYQGFLFPFPVQAYVSADKAGAPVILALVLLDSERKFWTKLMDKMLEIPKKGVN